MRAVDDQPRERHPFGGEPMPGLLRPRPGNSQTPAPEGLMSAAMSHLVNNSSDLPQVRFVSISESVPPFSDGTYAREPSGRNATLRGRGCTTRWPMTL